MKAIPNTSIMMLVLVSVLVCLYGLSGLKTNADYRVYFDKSDPLLKMNNQIGQQYSELDSLILILSRKEGSLLEADLLSFYPEFEQRLANINYVERINGFFQFTDADSDAVFLDTDVIEDPETLLKRLRTDSVSKNLITADGRFGLLKIDVLLPGENAAKEVRQFMIALESVVDNEAQLKTSSVIVNYSGTLALNEAYIDVVRHDLKRFIPFLFLIFLVSLSIFFKNYKIAGLLIGTAFFSAVTAFGIAGWFNWELAAINAFTPIIIMSLNIATSMHVVLNYFRFVAEGLSRTAAMKESIRFNLQALTLSKLTTAFGFLLLSFSPSPPVQIVGYIVAIGMLVSYILCLTVLRVLLPKLALSSVQAQAVINSCSLTKLGVTTLKNKSAILVLSSVLLVAGLIVIQQIKVDDNVYEYFPEDHRFRQGTQLIDKQFDGSIRLLYSIDSGKPYGVLDSDFRKRLISFTAWLREQDETARVDDVLSVALDKGVRLDSIKPVLEINTPEELGLEKALTEDYQALKVAVFLKTITASEIIKFDEKTRAWLKHNIGNYDYRGGVGPDILFAKLGERNAKSMFFSLGLALIVIGFITGILLRSWSALVIGLVCNLYPVIIVFAIWAMLGGYISLGSAMVMGMIMGIIVDDTLHMLLKYPRMAIGSTTEAIHSLYKKVCPAILITSITLAAGLLVGLFSGFRPIFELSLLSLSIILIAMLADLLLLPALMQAMKFKRV